MYLVNTIGSFFIFSSIVIISIKIHAFAIWRNRNRAFVVLRIYVTFYGLRILNSIAYHFCFIDIQEGLIIPSIGFTLGVSSGGKIKIISVNKPTKIRVFRIDSC